MVTIKKNHSENTYEVYCLSTDTKPIDGMTNTSTCYEMDTGTLYMFDEDGKRWLPQ